MHFQHLIKDGVVILFNPTRQLPFHSHIQSGCAASLQTKNGSFVLRFEYVFNEMMPGEYQRLIIRS
jgi:hypothetical protein